LKVPKNTVASIILKLKKIGTTNSFSSWLPGQTEHSREKGLGQEGDQEPDGHSDRAPEILCGNGRTFQKDNYFCSSQGFMVEWPDGSHSFFSSFTSVFYCKQDACF
jgi:hypothetical protein